MEDDDLDPEGEISILNDEKDLESATLQYSSRDTTNNRPNLQSAEQPEFKQSSPPPSQVSINLLTPSTHFERKNKTIQEENDLKLAEYRRKLSKPQLLSTQESQAIMFLPGKGIQAFHFDQVLDHKSIQRDMYTKVARDSVVTALNGFNAAILCYGQTGSGKTHTMFGPEGILDAAEKCLGSDAKSLPGASGIVIRTCIELFSAKTALKRLGISTSYTMQYVQIYNEKVTDLLTGTPVRPKSEYDSKTNERATVLHGAVHANIGGLRDVIRNLRVGETRKTFAETAMNIRSSRAHTILVFHINQVLRDLKKTCTTTLHLVDLAGSERIKKTGVEGERLAEAVNINISLMALGRVIGGLVESRSHIPFRDSRLTMILQNALQGNSRTTAVIACRSSEKHGYETLSSLRFGQRVGKITNSLKHAVTSVESALGAIRSALSRCRAQMRSMESRGNDGLKVYHSLRARYSELLQKQKMLEADFEIKCKERD